MPTGIHKITGLPFEIDQYESDKKIEDLDIQVGSFANQSSNLQLLMIL
jgi:hypothetical protein